MKKAIIGMSSIVMLGVAAYLLASAMMLNTVKNNVLEKNADIDEIVSIHAISSWGEWFLEYVCVVEMDGQTVRIWATPKGEITDKEPL